MLPSFITLDAETMHEGCIQANVCLVLGSCGHANLFNCWLIRIRNSSIACSSIPKWLEAEVLSATFGDLQRSTNLVLNFGKEGTAQ